MPASIAHRVTINSLNTERLVSAEVYPAPPSYLDEEEAALFSELLLFRAAADWRSASELHMLANLAEVFIETRRLKEDVLSNGIWEVDFNGKEVFRAAYKARQNNMRLIATLTAKLRLTEAALHQRSAKQMADRGAAVEEQARREKEALNSPMSLLLARPQQ